MNLLCESALEMQTFMQNEGWEFCFIGGLACELSVRTQVC